MRRATRESGTSVAAAAKKKRAMGTVARGVLGRKALTTRLVVETWTKRPEAARAHPRPRRAIETRVRGWWRCGLGGGGGGGGAVVVVVVVVARPLPSPGGGAAAAAAGILLGLCLSGGVTSDRGATLPRARARARGGRDHEWGRLSRHHSFFVIGSAAVQAAAAKARALDI
jgi:hypothetical protein